MPREAHNAPLHLFSAARKLVEFGGGNYQRRSEQTSRLLGQLFERLRGEGFAVSFTMEDFNRQYIKEHFGQLTPQEQQEVLDALPPEQRLSGRQGVAEAVLPAHGGVGLLILSSRGRLRHRRSVRRRVGTGRNQTQTSAGQDDGCQSESRAGVSMWPRETLGNTLRRLRPSVRQACCAGDTFSSIVSGI